MNDPLLEVYSFLGSLYIFYLLNVFIIAAFDILTTTEERVKIKAFKAIIHKSRAQVCINPKTLPAERLPTP